MKRAILVFLAAAVAVSGCGKKDDSEIVIARVEDRVITVADFERVAETIAEDFLPQTNDLEGKKELLNHMINKEVMGLKALSMGYDKEPWFVDVWARFRNPFLVAQMMDHMIERKIVVTDQDVQDYYNHMHYEYTISQIVMSEESEAAAVKERILAGEDFAELAKKYSLGEEAADGGYVGTMNVGNIHWWVEEALFKMEPGDVSDVMKTSTGYAIIKLHRKRKIEPVDDIEYVAKRVRAIKLKKGIDEFKSKIEKEIGLQFYTDAVNIAFDALPEDIPFADIMSRKINRDNAPKLAIPAQFRDMLICQYEDGSYTLADFEEIYNTLPLPERPRRQYGRNNIVTTMHKRVFDKVLPVYAEQKAKILEIPEVKKTLDEKKEMFLVQRLYDDQIKDEVTVTLRDMRDYYAQNLDMLLMGEKREFTILTVADSKLADEVYQKALEGANFTLLVRDYSNDENVKENLGRSGLHFKGDMPEYDEMGFALDGPNAISKPFQTPRGWAIMKLDRIEEEHVPTFEEAESTIKKNMLEIRYEEHLQEKLEKWREDYTIEIDESALDKAELKRTRA